MSKIKRNLTFLLLAVGLTALAAGVLCLRPAVMGASEPEGVTTTFTNDAGLWRADGGNTATSEIVQDPTEGGVWSLTLTGGSPTYNMDLTQGFAAADYPVFAMRVKYELQHPETMAHPSLGNRFSLYYASEKTGFGQALCWPRLTIQAVPDNPAEWMTVIVDLTDASNYHPDFPVKKWEGTVNKLRLQPIWSENQNYTAGDKISVDFIRFYPTVADAEADRDGGWEDDATVSGPGSEAFFNFTKGPQNWEQSQNNGAGSGWTDRGELKVLLGNDDPQLTFAWTRGISAECFKYMAVRMKNGTAATASKIYYTTAAQPALDESRSKSVSVDANSDYRMAVFDLSADTNWKGVVKSIRFDVVDTPEVDTGEIYVDYIKFCSSEEEIPALDWEDDDLTLPDGPVKMFSFTESAEGWTPNEDAGLECVYNALQLTMEAGKNDPNVTYRFSEPLDTSVYPVLRIRMRNRTPGTKMQIYFAGSGEVIDGSKVFEQTVTANDTTYQIYTLSLGAQSSWSDGSVETLRIDPTDQGGGTVLIDYVRFYRSVNEAETDGNFEDDPVDRPNAHTLFNFSFLNSYWKNESSSNANLFCSEGRMKFEILGGDPVAGYEYEHGDYSDWAEGIDASTWRFAVIKMKTLSSRTGLKANFAFKRNVIGDAFREEFSYTFDLTADGADQFYILDLGTNHFWNSAISAFRLSPIVGAEAGEVAEVDYIKFYRSRDDIAVDGETFRDDPEGEAKSYFDFTLDENRFDAARESHGKASITEEGMVTEITGQDPVLMYSYVYDGIGLDADVYKFMKICVKNETTATTFEVFWDNVGEDGVLHGWGATSNFTIETMSAGDTEFKTYIVDFSSKPDWFGTIARLRYDPAGWTNETDVSGRVTTRYIKFYKTAEEAAADDPLGGDPEDPTDPDPEDPTDPDPGKPGDKVTTVTEWRTSGLAVAGMAFAGASVLATVVGVALLVTGKKKD